MNLPWSSSSSSGRMLSGKRTGNSTCWPKISSMKKSTPKTREESGVLWRRTEHFVHAQSCALETNRSGSEVRLEDYRWPCASFESMMRSWRSNPAVTQRPDWQQLLLAAVPASWTRSSRFNWQVAIATGSCSTPFHFNAEGRPCRGPLPARVLKATGRQLIIPPLLIGFTVLLSRRFSLALYCLVVFGCILSLYYVFGLYVKTFDGETTCLTPHHHY